MPTSKELNDQIEAISLPQRKVKHVTCSACDGSGRDDWNRCRCLDCYGSGEIKRTVPFTAEEQAIIDQFNALRNEWLRVAKEEEAAAQAAREALPAFRRFQVATTNPEDGESLYVTVEVWMGEDGVIQTFWQEDEWRDDADHPNN